MKDGVGNGRRAASHGDLAPPLRAKRVEVHVWAVDKPDVYLTNVGVCRDDIVGEIIVKPAAKARVYFGRFAQQGADPPNDASTDLTLGSTWR